MAILLKKQLKFVLVIVIFSTIILGLIVLFAEFPFKEKEDKLSKNIIKVTIKSIVENVVFIEDIEQT